MQSLSMVDILLDFQALGSLKITKELLQWHVHNICYKPITTFILLLNIKYYNY